MSYDWKNVKLLSNPIQTTSNDVILSGHGKLLLSSGTTAVPAGIELWILAPPGAGISNSFGQALEDKSKVSYLGIRNPGSKVLINSNPFVYSAGQSAPNYTLSSPNGLVLHPGGPHILGVAIDTDLSSLWARVTPFVIPGKTLRVYWAACAAIAGAINPLVVFK